MLSRQANQGRVILEEYCSRFEFSDHRRVSIPDDLFREDLLAFAGDLVADLLHLVGSLGEDTHSGDSFIHTAFLHYEEERDDPDPTQEDTSVFEDRHVPSEEDDPAYD